MYLKKKSVFKEYIYKKKKFFSTKIYQKYNQKNKYHQFISKTQLALNDPLRLTCRKTKQMIIFNQLTAHLILINLSLIYKLYCIY